jgi:Antitoxin Phd_YefM, type II toxin-antitoxin system
MKTVTLTEFRKNIFRMVDEAVATGEPIVIDRNGARVVIRSEKRPTETDEERAERWRKFWASPPEIHEDLSLDDIRKAREAYWKWDGEPELDR